MLPLIAALVAQPAKLGLGDPAPPLAVAKWYKGQPVPTLKKGKVYVVEFWATWCGPCKEAMPHLSALARKYAGKAEVVSVGIWEKPETLAADAKLARKFVASQGARMDYHVGGDDGRETMAKTWMAAAGQGGIPTSFVVDANGRIAYIGSPNRLEEPLSQVVAGKFDLTAAKRASAIAVERDRIAMADFDAARKALKDKDYDAALAAIARGWTTEPKYRSDLLSMKFQAIAGKSSEADAYADLKALVAGELKDDGDMLWRIAWMIDAFPFVKTRDLAFAQDCAERSVDLAKVPDWNRLTVLGMVLNDNKLFARAVEIQTQAVAIARKENSLSEENIKKLEEMLAKYKEAAHSSND